eukprot:Filipodium_phascolosomae@DN6750_c0_g1_i1.p1
MLVDNKNELEKYAMLYYSDMLSSYKYLAFRDIPELLRKHHVCGRCLDYGCGCGESTRMLKSIASESCVFENVEGVDINLDMINLAKKSDMTGMYTLIKSAQAPHEGSTFDLVFSSFVLVELATKEELNSVVKEVSRVLKENGKFIAIVCSENYYMGDWADVRANFQNETLTSGDKIRVDFLDKGFSIEDYYWSRQDYMSAFAGAGLKCIEIHEPLGLVADRRDWKDELRISPTTIFVTEKIPS